MVLSFALIATLGFAQTNNGVKHLTPGTPAVGVSKLAPQDVQSKADYNGSIFTKDDEPLFYADFAVANQGYSTGTVLTPQMVNGEQIPVHGQTAYHSRWNRIESYTDTILNETNYPASFDDWYSWLFRPNRYEDPSRNALSGEAGIMIMTMQDQIIAWGGHGTIGNFDAYIAFPAFSTTGEGLVHARLYQYYRKFNQDHCWLDYSVDNSTWYAVEFNVRGVDVNTNDAIQGWVDILLPRAVADEATVYTRIRWACSSNSGGAYGYVWALDDFMVLPCPDNSVAIEANEYFEGFYQMMPKDLQLPVVWNNTFLNNGQLSHNNVTGGVYYYENYGDPATKIAEMHRDSIVPAEKTHLVVDPLGWYDAGALTRPSTENGWNTANGIGYWQTGYDCRTGEYGILPTSELGVGHFFSDIRSSLRPNHIGSDDVTTFDTLRYEVNWGAFNDSVDCGVWARDNGAVREASSFILGVNSEGYWTDDPDECGFNRAGYGVYISYVTGDTVPEGWKILGMELVASTDARYQDPLAKLDAVLFFDRRDSTGTPVFYYLNTGASTYAVDPENDYIDANEIHSRYYENDHPAMKTIRIDFPNQPDLEPLSSYRVGYNLNEDASFAVATNANYYYKNDTLRYFANTEGMESYGHALGLPNRFTLLMEQNDGISFYSNHDEAPMIRLLVGPGFYVPKVPITFECDDEGVYGTFQNGGEQVLCGTTDSIPVGGASSTIYIMPVDESYQIETVWINGQPISLGSTDDYTFDTTKTTSGLIYGTLHLNNVQEAKTLRCKFKEAEVGIDPVASKVSMKLQPNPASSNVHITLKGVTGMVNMSLLDMSGRVVTSSQFNAENGTNVNVSNLAKGAYFVRITNNNFTKIEKLIVR